MHLLVFLLLGICLGTVHAEQKGVSKRDIYDTPRNLLTHFIVSARNLEKVIEELDVALETHYKAWGLDTIDTDDTFENDDVEDLVRCDGDSQCDLELDVYFTLDTTLSEDQDGEVCDFIAEYLSKRAGLSGSWDCSTGLANGTSTGYYVASLVYSETEEDNGFGNDFETDFVFSLWQMEQAARDRDLDDEIENEFSDWDLNTHNADGILEYFDRNYWCDFSDNYCEIEFILPFAIDTGSMSDEDEDSLCEAIQAFFVREADVGGDWDCRIVARTTVDDSNEYYAVMTYSEGGGLTFGEKVGIAAGSIILFMILVGIIALIFVSAQSKSRADYV